MNQSSHARFLPSKPLKPPATRTPSLTLTTRHAPFTLTTRHAPDVCPVGHHGKCSSGAAAEEEEEEEDFKAFSFCGGALHQRRRRLDSVTFGFICSWFLV